MEILMEIFKPELEEAETKGKIEGKIEVYFNELKYSSEKIAKVMELNVEEVEKIIASLP